MFALWHHKTETIQSMAAKPDTFIVAKEGKEQQARNLWEYRGRMMLASRARLNTVRAFSVRLEERALGSLWVPCKLTAPVVDGITDEKAVCVYLNSSMGIFAWLGNRTNKILSYPQFSIDDMRNYPVPDFAAIGGTAVAQLAAAYDEYADAVLLPLPQLNNCPARQGLDAAVIAALGLDGELVANIRRQLAMEPSVTGQRYAGF